MSGVLRHATAADAAALTRIAYAAKAYWGYPAELLELWRADLTVTPEAIARDRLACAVEDERIVGFYGLSDGGGRWELEHLWVDPERIGTGVGRRLLAHAMAAIAATGGGSLEIASDPHAEAFYLRMGARRAGTAPSTPPGRELPRLRLDVPAAAQGVRLRRSRREDLDLVLALERDAANAPFIGQWSRDEHLRAIAGDAGREHWIVEDGEDGGARHSRLGYLIAYDLVARGHGAYVKRVVVADKSRGIGRRAIAAFAAHARCDLGADRVWLTVFADNQRAQRAYGAAGFAIDPRSEDERAALREVVGGFSATSLVMALDLR